MKICLRWLSRGQKKKLKDHEFLLGYRWLTTGALEAVVCLPLFSFVEWVDELDDTFFPFESRSTDSCLDNLGGLPLFLGSTSSRISMSVSDDSSGVTIFFLPNFPFLVGDGVDSSSSVAVPFLKRGGEGCFFGLPGFFFSGVDPLLVTVLDFPAEETAATSWPFSEKSLVGTPFFFICFSLNFLMISSIAGVGFP